MTAKNKNPLIEAELLELFEHDMESVTDEEFLRMATFLREESAKYETELEVRSVKRKAKAANAKGTNLSDILSDSLED